MGSKSQAEAPIPTALPEFSLLRSKRKTLAIQVFPGQEIVVRAPLYLPLADIQTFVESKAAWIQKHWQSQPNPAPPTYNKAEEMELRRQAQEILPGLVEHFSRLMGLQPRRLSITSARTRFGSCSSKGSLCFSWRLMAYPRAAIEYVVVHELAHLTHLNHSPAFYQLVSHHLPDYKARAQLLKLPPGQNISQGEQDV